MHYQQKKVLVTIFTNILILISYFIYLSKKNQAGVVDMAMDLKFWAATMLIFIGIMMVAMIIIMIIFHIINAIINEVRQRGHDEPLEEDEMDKLINLKSSKHSFIISGIGFIISLIAVLLGQSPGVMINIIFVSCFLGGIGEGIWKLYYYSKGI